MMKLELMKAHFEVFRIDCVSSSRHLLDLLKVANHNLIIVVHVNFTKSISVKVGLEIVL
jgi:hypothetical protein